VEAKLLNPKRILRFGGRVLLLLLPLYASVLLLAFLASRSRTPPPAGQQLKLMLAASFVPATLALIGGFLLAMSYLQAMYALKGKREAFWHLVHCLFGLASVKPWLRVETGKVNVPPTEMNRFIVKAGGPGNVIVRKDSAVVLERGGRLTKAAGPGLASLEPFERIYDTVDLRPRRWQHPVPALSKEGIPVTCETDIEFQIQDGGQQPTGETPFPADLKAVFAAVTSKWIREPERGEDDRVLDWKGHIVVSAAEGTLRFILARYPLDRLMAPTVEGQEHSRQAICRELEEALRVEASNVGAKILKVALGEIRVEDEVTQQWIETWRANWDHWGLEYLAASEALSLKVVGKARSEALAQKIGDTVTILHQLRQRGEEEFIAGTKLQLSLALRSIGSDSIALTYMPAEAMRLLQQVIDPSPGSPQQAGAGPSGSQAPAGPD
jgi:hypothetical protein